MNKRVKIMDANEKACFHSGVDFHVQELRKAANFALKYAQHDAFCERAEKEFTKSAQLIEDAILLFERNGGWNS